MIIDSAVHMLVNLLLAMLLLMASLHKFSQPPRFRGILAAYAILPVIALPVATYLIPIIELGLGLAWLSGFSITMTVTGTVCLLALYAAAMAFNIWRGNVEIDCGCSFKSSGKDETGQRLSIGLVFRNVVLILLALLALLPGNGRELALLDYALMLFALSSIALMYAAFNQLLANRDIIVANEATRHG